MINLNRSISIWILLSLFLTLFLSKAEVITLTPEIFSDKVKEKDTAWFVKFCVPWCKHCKNLGTLWEEVGKAMEGEDEIEVGEVDCGASKSVCSKADIHSYPTFKLFFDGEEVAKYQDIGSKCFHNLFGETLVCEWKIVCEKLKSIGIFPKHKDTCSIRFVSVCKANLLFKILICLSQ
ncbi:PROTEIN DISULFIDE-ISOMERASE C17H9.14C-RELATED [Salix viminalis]|uniref:PROTEIN DISULFIDE-ISOMERASE C17H9.14C-RELATED n=1 Tax=Salix viminalis TaxID=40686 RepID=A0A9Q0NIR6_SALVM|nr:PROTEIN DISULFIDE-ISOMERASE C17H9.14C-RELATED [Salix viminalis]